MGLFQGAGKQNDVDNTRHMQNRREWDLARLTSLLSPDRSSWRSRKAELKSFTHYIRQDLKMVFSIKPWKQLAHTYREKSTWLEPNTYITGIGTQFGLLANTVSLCSLKASKKLQGTLGMLAFPLLFINNLAYGKTNMIRGWQDRTDLDGKLLMAAFP